MPIFALILVSLFTQNQAMAEISRQAGGIPIHYGYRVFHANCEIKATNFDREDGQIKLDRETLERLTTSSTIYADSSNIGGKCTEENVRAKFQDFARYADKVEASPGVFTGDYTAGLPPSYGLVSSHYSAGGPAQNGKIKYSQEAGIACMQQQTKELDLALNDPALAKLRQAMNPSVLTRAQRWYQKKPRPEFQVTLKAFTVRLPEEEGKLDLFAAEGVRQKVEAPFTVDSLSKPMSFPEYEKFDGYVIEAALTADGCKVQNKAALITKFTAIIDSAASPSVSLQSKRDNGVR